MKGIVLSGGMGTRLQPLTNALSKQLLPVYKYPMIYFPLCTLRDMDIKDVLIITTPQHKSLYEKTLEHVTELNLSFIVQNEPKGLAEAFILAEDWLEGDDATLILGDNIFINNDSLKNIETNTVFTFQVKQPERYGVVKKNSKGEVVDIVEKPKTFISDDALIGMYVLNNSACDYAKKLKPSARGELEIVDLINSMMQDEAFWFNNLNGYWFDAGTHDDLLDCGNFIKAVEDRTNRTFDVK